MINKEINQLLDTMAQLRHPQTGCRWDCEQDFKSLRQYTLEETYEVFDAIENKDWKNLKEELGDLLFQIVFYAQIAEEKQLFSFADIVKTLNKKLIQRHPHVFEETNNTLSAEEISTLWDKRKLKEYQQKSVLDNIPATMPELLKAVKLCKKAAIIGFDWHDIAPVFAKLDEEIAELKQAIAGKNTDEISDELGDVLFVCTNLARHLNTDPQLAMRAANKKFERRFRKVEVLARQQHPLETSYALDYLDKLWNKVKKMNNNH